MKNSQNELINHNATPPVPSAPSVCPTVWLHCCRLSAFLAVRARATLPAKSCSKEKFNRKIAQTLKTTSCNCALQLLLHLPNIRQLASFIVIVKCPIRRRRMSPYSTPQCMWTPSRPLMKLLIMRRMLYFSQFGCQPLSSDTLYVTCWPSAQRGRERERGEGEI